MGGGESFEGGSDAVGGRIVARLPMASVVVRMVLKGDVADVEEVVFGRWRRSNEKRIVCASPVEEVLFEMRSADKPGGWLLIRRL